MSEIKDYRYKTDKRKNIPPAKIAAEGKVPSVKDKIYAYSPRRPPSLRFDLHGKPDKLPKLLETAKKRPLTDEEVSILAEALRNHEPWLEWAGKQEKKYFRVDPVELHIHERVSTKATLKAAKRLDVQRSLFADPELEYHKEVQFYQHDVDWANRMILGDSLQVMNSLAYREDLAGKVQMIYLDPPYGIKFASNFQPEIGKREVKDREQDLTREPEMVKAYRDTWHLGKHSYLSYMRDRLRICHDLLADSGSVFVQISDENVHLVRNLMDEVFGQENFVCEIIFTKTTGLGQQLLDPINDYLLWFAKDKPNIRYRQLFYEKTAGETGASRYINKDYDSDKLFATSDMRSQSGGQTISFTYEYQNKLFTPLPLYWKTNIEGITRLANADKLLIEGKTLRYKRYLSDFPINPVSNLWTDVGGIQSRTDPKVYVVQTTNKVIERCLLMTTDPGDLVLDPTCGSGTTAYVAEQWGRRWITMDTSRVAIAIARQRLLTATYNYYKLKDESKGVSKGFVCKSVPHITLKSIAQNENLDPIFEKHEPILEEKRSACNLALKKVTKKLRSTLQAKLTAKQKAEGKRAITDADKRRWELPKKGETWEHWEIPFDTDPDWPKELQNAVTEYRKAWRAKMEEVNACIGAYAKHEELVDQPEIEKKIIRVSGPFSVESVQPPEISLDETSPQEQPGLFDGAPDELEDTFDSDIRQRDQQNAQTYIDGMIRLLRMDGVCFLDNRQMKFTRLEPIHGDAAGIHAEGRWAPECEEDHNPHGQATVCVVFGPQYGPVTAKMIEKVIRPANRMGYDDLLIAGFSFDGPAQSVIEESQHPNLKIHAANIRPDINPGMDGLLKEQPRSQLFSVFGQPRTKLRGPDKNGEYEVIMEGVDIYNPVTNAIYSTGAEKIAAWFLDSNYDGRTFCLTQAFFPNKKAWTKLAKALNGHIDPYAFEIMSGTISLPFAPGKHKTAAIKVIDPRGNEVMKIHKL